ncbi:MAG: hypothetical protein K2K60_00470 [Clostridia bacterium]|nr:hypothetical protein [Clostridia bacterium]
MKTQMRFQKILMLVTLVIAAVSIVYALIFCSGIMMQVSLVLEFDNSDLGATELYNASQSFSDLFLILGVILIVATVLLYITACQKRRKYYVTNYVAIGIVLAYQLVYIILLIINVVNINSAYNNLDMAQCELYYNTEANATYGKWSSSTWMISLGYAYAAILFVNMAALVLNLVWKIKLMKGEKKLLESGLVKEVA